MCLLEDEDVQKVMHWLPCGRAFEILDPDLCAETVLQNHFNSVKFESFIVRLKSEYRDQPAATKKHASTFSVQHSAFSSIFYLLTATQNGVSTERTQR
jgi:hypothetical protein